MTLDARDGRALSRRNLPADFNLLALSADGLYAAGGRHCEVVVWMRDGGQETAHIMERRSSARNPARTGLAFGSSGLAYNSVAGDFRLIDPASGRLLRKYAHPQGRALKAVSETVALSPDGRQLLASFSLLNHDRHEAILFEVQSGAVIEVFPAEARYHWTGFCSGEPLLISGARNLTVRRGKAELILRGHTWRGPRTVAVSPDGLRAASAAQEIEAESTAVRIWDLISGLQTSFIYGSLPPEVLAWSPDGKRLLAGGVGAEIHDV